MKTATYLYCVVRAARKPAATAAPEGLPGAGRPDVVPVAASLWLITATVPLDVYGAEPLESVLSDLDQVGRIGLAHEAVVEHFARRPGLTVVPMKLFTMFSTRARAVADIAAHRRTLETAMKRIAGKEEWGVRVTAEKPAARRATTARGATSGTAFLSAKRKARDDVQNAKASAAQAAVAAFERLHAVARDARRRHDAPAAITPPLLDAAFLVRAKDRDRFTAVAREQADACALAGAQLVLTGPWPAYNFIQTDGGQ